MSETSDKNRLSFDDEGEESTRWIYQDEDTTGQVRLDETKEQTDHSYAGKGRSRFALFLGGGLVLLLLLLGGLVYLYWWNNDGRGATEEAQGDKITLTDGDRVNDRFYFPVGAFSAELKGAIAAYEANRREEASRKFENFIQSSGKDEEKSVALVYTGIMAMETERYALARHHLIRALKYDPRSIAANVNLAIVERRLGNLADARSYIMRARELAPDDPGVNMVAGNLLADSDDVDGAIESFREGIEKDDTDPMLHYNLALSLLRKGQAEEAELEFSKAISYSGGGEIAAKSHAHLGQLSFAKGNLELAADHLKKATTIAPENARYSYNLGVLYLRMNRSDDAITLFEKALKTGANDNAVYRGLARAFVEAGQPSLAIQALRSALVSNPQDIESLFQLGELYSQQNDLLAAVDVYKKIVNITPGDANTVDALGKLGFLSIDLERYNDAIEMFEKALRLKPEDVSMRLGLGSAYLKAGQKDRAVMAWKEALNRTETPGSGSPPLERKDEKMIRMALAGAYLGDGGYEMALQQYRLVEGLNQKEPVIPDDPELDMAIAETYLAMGNYRSAALYLEKVADSPISSPDLRKAAYRNLAQSYSRSNQIQNLSRARSYIERAQRMDPNDYELDLIQSRILLESNSMVDREKAIEVLQTITNSNTKSSHMAKAYEYLGKAYYLNGEYARSVRSYDMALQLDPSSAIAQSGRRSAANAYERSLEPY